MPSNDRASPMGWDHMPAVLRALAWAAREHPFERKLMVCARAAHGRELLRALAHRGQPWINFETATPAQLAVELVANDLAVEGIRPTDEFDELALLDAAMDQVFAESGDGLAQLAEGFGLRQAVVHAVRALRLAGVTEAMLERARFRDERKRAQIARILSIYEARLAASHRTDTAGMIRHATAALTLGTVVLPYDQVFLLPGQSMRGLSGQLLGELVDRGARVLLAEPVFGLEPPQHRLTAPQPDTSADHGSPQADERSGEHAASGVGILPFTRLAWLHAPAHAPVGGTEPIEIRMFAASSLTSELREVLRRAAAEGLRWDEVEIVATDATTYGVALDGLARRLGIPVSYAMGLPISRTRPGRAVAKYLDWIQTGFPADQFRQMLERGDIGPPADTVVNGTSLARLLRRLEVGRGRARYVQAMERRARVLETPQSPEDERSPGEFAEQRGRDRAELAALQAILLPLLQATPPLPEPGGPALSVSPASLARGLLALLGQVQPGTGVDVTARERLERRLRRIEATLERPTTLAAAIAIITSKLDDRVPAPDEPGTAPWTASGGFLHLSDLEHGGLAGRRATFIVGLDASRFPGGSFRDALLVDDDRRRLASGAPPATGAGLPTAAERIEERRYAFAALVARLRGTVTFSYAAWDAVEGRTVAPASELLQLHRLRTGDPAADYEALHAELDPAASPIPRPGLALDADDSLLGSLAHKGRLRAGLRAILQVYPWLQTGLSAHLARKGKTPTPWHGVIEPRPRLDPRGDPRQVLSASRLQDLGTCPHRYLLKHVLRVRKPEDLELSPEQWLNALARGSLMHAVYERALTVARDERLQLSDDAFEQRVLDILAQKAAELRTLLPAPGEAIYRLECEQLAEDARAFVAMIREDGDRFIALERKFGLDGGSPAVAITLPGGRSLHIAGAIDRIDQLEDGRLVIIDYKTGSAFRFGSRQGGFDGGRRLQHVVYAAVARLLYDAEVARAEFHFPTRASENHRATFEPPVLAQGLEVIEQLIDMAARGEFVPTNEGEDCSFCDFTAVCRVKIDAKYRKVDSPMADWSRNTPSDVLSTLRRLRGR